MPQDFEQQLDQYFDELAKKGRFSSDKVAGNPFGGGIPRLLGGGGRHSIISDTGSSVTVDELQNYYLQTVIDARVIANINVSQQVSASTDERRYHLRWNGRVEENPTGSVNGYAYSNHVLALAAFPIGTGKNSSPVTLPYDSTLYGFTSLVVSPSFDSGATSLPDWSLKINNGTGPGSVGITRTMSTIHPDTWNGLTPVAYTEELASPVLFSAGDEVNVYCELLSNSAGATGLQQFEHVVALLMSVT